MDEILSLLLEQQEYSGNEILPELDLFDPEFINDVQEVLEDFKILGLFNNEIK